MQEFRSIPGLSERIFGGGAELRRFGSGRTQDAPAAAAKCPRCESSNTKFCYYNNYNLAQPRHFCRACRRYWTKGGVLRNVPVGGGCRKSSSSSSSSSSKKSSKNRRKSSTASNSSSDSSTLTTASNPNPAPSPELDAVGGSDQPPPSSLPPPPVIPAPDMFPEMGTFTSLMAAAAAAGPPFLSFSDPPALQLQQQMYQKTDDFRMTSGFTVAYPLHQLERRTGGGDGLEWNRAIEEPVFDFAGPADHGAYWNTGQWDVADPSLFLP